MLWYKYIFIQHLQSVSFISFWGLFVPYENAVDVLGVSREISYSDNHGERLLCCEDIKVNTHCDVTNDFVKNPPAPWDPVGVSAHANTLEVAKFLRDDLEHDGIDGLGMNYKSLIHIDDDNAYWNPSSKIFSYGKHNKVTESSTGTTATIYYASGMSIVAHEIFHGVTHFTAGLISRGQSGALNESYSDIFGVLLANRLIPDISKWIWEIGVPASTHNPSFSIRNLQDPSIFGHPVHMNDYEYSITDAGGIHSNNAIHNQAAYNLITSRNPKNNKYLFDFNSASLLFYSALERLKPYDEFVQSRIALTLAAHKCFDDYRYKVAISAINKAFDDVGIQ
jgi:Zn-dependent metalloprotease